MTALPGLGSRRPLRPVRAAHGSVDVQKDLADALRCLRASSSAAIDDILTGRVLV